MNSAEPAAPASTGLAIPGTHLAIERRYVIFIVTSAAMAVGLFERVALAAIATDLRAEFGLSAGQLSNLAASYYLVYALTQIPTGLIIDRWSARWLMAGFLVIAGAGSLVFALAPTYAWLAGARLLVGLGVAVIFISSLKLIAAWFPARDLALWNGLFSAVAQIGLLLAGRPLVELTRIAGWRTAFVIAAVCAWLVAIALAVFVREGPGVPSRPARARASDGPKMTLGRLLRSPVLWLVGLGGFLIGGTSASFQAMWSGPYLADVHGFAPATVGNFLLLIPLGLVAGSFVLGWVADRLLHSRPGVLLAALTFFTLGWVPLAAATTQLGAGMLAALYVGSFGFMWSSYALVFPILRERFPDNVGNTVAGIANLLSMMGGFGIQRLFGLLLDRFPPVAGAYPPAAYHFTFTVALGLAATGLVLSAAGILRRPATR